MARPSKFTADRQAAFVRAIGQGATRAIAAAQAGWSERAAYGYLAHAQDVADLDDAGHRLDPRQEEYLRFLQQVRKSEADVVAQHLANIARAGQRGEWQASAWFLERRYPQEFGRRRVEVVSEPDVVHEAPAVSAEDLLRLLRNEDG